MEGGINLYGTGTSSQPCFEAAALSAATGAASMANTPANHQSTWDLEIISTAQTHSQLQQGCADIICLILSARFHLRGAREEDTKKTFRKISLFF